MTNYFLNVKNCRLVKVLLVAFVCIELPFCVCVVRDECELGGLELDRRHEVREDTGTGLVDEEEEGAH